MPRSTSLSPNDAQGRMGQREGRVRTLPAPATAAAAGRGNQRDPRDGIRRTGNETASCLYPPCFWKRRMPGQRQPPRAHARCVGRASQAGVDRMMSTTVDSHNCARLSPCSRAPEEAAMVSARQCQKGGGPHDASANRSADEVDGQCHGKITRRNISKWSCRRSAPSRSAADRR